MKYNNFYDKDKDKEGFEFKKMHVPLKKFHVKEENENASEKPRSHKKCDVSTTMLVHKVQRC
jgi:hypothetical protein